MSKVIGLGAPLSVSVTFLPAEAPVLRDELDAEIAAFATAVAEHPGEADRVDALMAVHELRRQVPQVPCEPFTVLAPTALMSGVLAGALREATDQAHQMANVAPLELERLLVQVLAVEALLLTFRDFLVVDGGGLPAVWL